MPRSNPPRPVSAFWVSALAALAMLVGGENRVRAAEPTVIVDTAALVLDETMAIPAKAIPEALLRRAEGVAIIPNVLKIGLIGGVSRGRGVVMIRNADGQWGEPSFVTITGGSVGFQIGAQATDLVLVFCTPQSVRGLMQGKLTIGADASAAAGPIGRSATAATDGELKAEIYSYSRSRGLFAGVALDGSVLQIDSYANSTFFAGRTPESAVKLVNKMNTIAPWPQATARVAPPDLTATGAQPVSTVA
ncbi:MAG TPA: lipid-binding SYLF domain-containing protein, partial [Pirellulales bacterium]